jgi:DNA-directed RNA polymerase specialized sigma24 family protein
MLERASNQKINVSLLAEEGFRETPLLTKPVFNRLLEWLDDGVESHGERYVEMRRRLVLYFERRHRPHADELADETLNRISRTLERSGVIVTRPPARYCYVIARFVLLEDYRREARHVRLHESETLLGSLPGCGCALEPDLGLVIQQQRLDCLDHCLLALKPEQRELVVEYYRDTGRQKIERRRDIAGRLGITMNALGIRVCRIRDVLTECMERCGNGCRRV